MCQEVTGSHSTGKLLLVADETYPDDNVQVSAGLLLQDYEFVFTMQELRITSPSDGPVRKLSRQRSRAGTRRADEVS